ncbi:hypothetical protein [Paenibacillus durus]|uniref:Carbohydrate kinase PfkB domain-containing protein n=1 Tax=Paenibacillus durus TaxID=44251 RepID=A0A089HK90_PAEDU|nr:hypothetical protein [Paenibacillus durus]AIQ11502.1 hypothetical protein PDUR_05705 [Paenibacillus durus]
MADVAAIGELLIDFTPCAQDTTGADDAFLAGILYGLLSQELAPGEVPAENCTKCCDSPMR